MGPYVNFSNVAVVSDYIVGWTPNKVKFENIIKVHEIYDDRFKLSSCRPHSRIPRVWDSIKIQIR